MTFDLRCSCAVELIEPQLAVLLQLVQLWSVLGRLAQPLEDDFDLASNVTNTTMEAIAGIGQGRPASVPLRQAMGSSLWRPFNSPPTNFKTSWRCSASSRAQRCGFSSRSQRR